MMISQELVNAESTLREGNAIKCFEQYEDVIASFRKLNDYETASYFYNRQLEVSREANYVSGEARAYKGLGICEENVQNIFESMKYHEIAL